MKKVIILRGLPGSWKSQLARNIINSKNTFKKVSGHNIQEMTGPLSPFDVFEMELSMIDLLLLNGHNVVVDDINENQETVDAIKEIAEMNEAEVVIYLLKTPLPVCLENNKMRLSNVRPEVIERLYREYFHSLY